VSLNRSAVSTLKAVPIATMRLLAEQNDPGGEPCCEIEVVQIGGDSAPVPRQPGHGSEHALLVPEIAARRGLVQEQPAPNRPAPGLEHPRQSAAPPVPRAGTPRCRKGEVATAAASREQVWTIWSSSPPARSFLLLIGRGGASDGRGILLPFEWSGFIAAPG
jgi:hypothetical protein